MPGVFINYRRTDAGGDINRIDERLTKAFHDDDVFLDQRSLQPSRRFDVALVEQVRDCDVFVAVVGPGWMTLSDNGEPRIRREGDHVRGEIAEALKAKVHIIPVLLKGAKMPEQQALPDDIRGFAVIQAHVVYAGHFDEDVNELIRRIRRVFRVPRSAVRRALLLYRPRRARSALLWIGFDVSLLLGVGYTIAALSGLGRGFIPLFETLGAVLFSVVAGVLRFNAAEADRMPRPGAQAVTGSCDDRSTSS